MRSKGLILCGLLSASCSDGQSSSEGSQPALVDRVPVRDPCTQPTNHCSSRHLEFEHFGDGIRGYLDGRPISSLEQWQAPNIAAIESIGEIDRLDLRREYEQFSTSILSTGPVDFSSEMLIICRASASYGRCTGSQAIIDDLLIGEDCSLEVDCDTRSRCLTDQTMCDGAAFVLVRTARICVANVRLRPAPTEMRPYCR